MITTSVCAHTVDTSIDILERRDEIVRIALERTYEDHWQTDELTLTLGLGDEGDVYEGDRVERSREFLRKLLR